MPAIDSSKGTYTQHACCRARFRGNNTDMSRVQQFKRHEKDTGSSEVQISILSARIAQVSTHLKANKKDYASRRGLEAMLTQRRHFMQYLYKHDRYKNVPKPLKDMAWLCQDLQYLLVCISCYGIDVLSSTLKADLWDKKFWSIQKWARTAHLAFLWLSRSMIFRVRLAEEIYSIPVWVAHTSRAEQLMPCRNKYEDAIERLNIRPLRIQAGKGVVVKQTAEGLVVDKAPAIAGEQQEQE